MGMKRHRVSLYITQFNLKCVSVTTRVIDIQRMNVLSYNDQVDIWNRDKMPSCVEPHNFRESA